MQFMISRDVFGVTLHLTTLVKKKKEKNQVNELQLEID